MSCQTTKTIEVYSTITPNDTVLVSSVKTPFFCFEAKDIDAACELVKRAMEFYEKRDRSKAPQKVTARAYTTLDSRWARSIDHAAVA